MWDEIRQGDAGQAVVESAVLLAACAVGGLAIGWPLLRRLLDAWQLHQEAVLQVVDLPLP